MRLFLLLSFTCISLCTSAQQTSSLKVAEHYALVGLSEKANASLDSVLQQLLAARDTNTWCSAVGTVGKAYSRKHPDKAIAHFQKHIQLAEALFGPQHLVIAELHARIGDVYRKAQVGDFIKAAEHFDNAIALYERHGVSNRFLGFVYHFAGNCHTRNGSYEKASRYLNQSAEIRVREGDSLYVAQVCNDLGILYNDLGSYMSAELMFSKGIRFIDKQSPSRKQKLLQATLLLNQTDNNLSLGTNMAVDSLLAPALEVFSRYEDLSGMSAANRSIGQWLLEKERPEEALDYLQKGLHLAKRNYGKHHREVAKAHVALSKALREMGSTDSALAQLQYALQSLIPSFAPVDGNTLPKQEYLHAEPWLLITLQEKADAHVELYKNKGGSHALQRALACYDAALVTMELIRDQYSYQADRERLFSSFHSVIEGGIFTALELAKKTKLDRYNASAFGYLRQSKAYSLMEWFSGYEAQSLLSIPDSITSRERSLISRMLGLTATTQLDELSTVKKEFEQLTKAIGVEYPAYYDIKYGSKGFSIEETRDHLLESDEVLLEYVLTETGLACFLVSDQQFKVWSWEIGPDFQKLLSTFIDHLRSPNLGQPLERLAEEIGEEGYLLYKQLLSAPLLYLDSEGLGANNIIIIPDGNLHYLPFESLVCEAPLAGISLGQMEFLVKSRSIRYGYSPSTLQHQKMMQPSEAKLHDLVAFAPNDDLIHARAELQSLSELLEGQFFFGENATKEEFIEQSGKSKILHIAAHGHLFDDYPMKSGISFIKLPEDTQLNAGELFAFELFNLNIAAELVVLGACNTGRGRLIDGEGVMSLERGFSYARCKSTVMTLWDVNDKSTAEVLTDFYRNLKADSPKHEALRKAQMNYLINAGGIKAHPYFWAGIVFHGDTSSMNLTKSPSIWLLILLALPLLTLVLWFLGTKRS